MSERNSQHIRIGGVIMHKEAIDHVCVGSGGDSIEVVMRCGQEYEIATNDAQEMVNTVTRILDAEVLSD